MKLYILIILLICIDYAFLDCQLSSDGMNVEKSVCLGRKVGDNETPEVATHTPDTCCLISTSGTVSGQTINKSYCAALEKAKASDFEKENNEKYGSLGTTKVECEDSSAATKSSNSSESDSPFIRFGLISFLFLLL